MNFDVIITYVLRIPAILVAITIHEFTKALTSVVLGDSAPKNDGRLTLNPFKHFEPIGFIFMLFLGFGWGKPVRTSGVYYKDRRAGTIMTYTAPILADIVFSLIFALLSGFVGISLKGVLNYDVLFYIKSFISFLIQYNLSLAVFNIIPVSPLCGNRIMTAFMTPNNALKMTHYEKIFQIILVMLMLFGFVGSIINPVIEGIINSYNYLLMALF